MVNSEGNKEGLSVYEIGYLILPSIPEDKLTNTIDSIRKVIIKEGGVELESEAPFKHPLAYPMSKTIGASRYVVSDAYLGWIKFEVDPSNTSAIKAKVEKINEVLRFLLIKVPRKTSFTFAKAKEAAQAKLEEKEREKEEEENPSSVEEIVIE